MCLISPDQKQGSVTQIPALFTFHLVTDPKGQEDATYLAGPADLWTPTWTVHICHSDHLSLTEWPPRNCACSLHPSTHQLKLPAGGMFG
jgi:hypothetical protein